MSVRDVNCANCGAVCGSYDEGRTYGDPYDCYPAEYVVEPPFTDDDGTEFCSEECMKEYRGGGEE